MKCLSIVVTFLLLTACAGAAPLPERVAGASPQSQGTEYRQLKKLFDEYISFKDDPVYLREGFSANFVRADWLDRVHMVPQMLGCSEEGSTLLISWAMVTRRQGEGSIVADKLLERFNTYLGKISYRDSHIAHAGAQLTLIVSSDTQGVLEAQPSVVGPVGGFPRRLAAIDMLRSVNVALMVLDAGDMFTEDPEAIRNNVELVRSMNLAGYDVAGLGIHDLHLGWTALQRLASQAKFPFVCSNLKSEENRSYIKPYVVLQKNGYNVGILSLCPDVSGLESLLLPAEIALARILPEVRDKCDVIILLTQYREADLAKALARFPEVFLVQDDAGAMATHPEIADKLSLGRGLSRMELDKGGDGKLRPVGKPVVLEIMPSQAGSVKKP